jgi:hypothetical protein
VRHRGVNQNRPKNQERDHRAELHTFGERPGDKGGGNDGEHQLIHHESLLRYGRGIIHIGLDGDVVEKNIFQPAHKAVSASEAKAIADHCPEHGDQSHQSEALHHGAKNVFLAHQPAVKQGEAGSRHHQHQRRAGQHPRVVCGTLSLRGLLLQPG